MSSVRTYAPDKVVVTFRGNVLTGFAKGTFLKVTRNSDSIALTIGSAGEGARTRSSDRSAKVEITLLQQSPTNDILSSLVAEDEAFGTGQGALLVKDLSGTSLFEAQNAWVVKPADAEFADAGGERSWTLESDRVAMGVGGNS
jgi:hypothetical protein